MRKTFVAAAGATALLSAVLPAASALAGQSVVVPNQGFIRSVCDQSEAQYVTAGRLHVVKLGSHLNGQAMKGIGVEATYDANGNPVPLDANGDPIPVDANGVPTDPSQLVPTGTTYVGNFRDNTHLRTLHDGTVWAHFNGGSTINGSNGTSEVNRLNAIAIYPAGTTDIRNTQPLKVIKYQTENSCTVDGQVIYDNQD